MKWGIDFGTSFSLGAVQHLDNVQLLIPPGIYGIPSLAAYAWPYRTAPSTVLSVIEAKENEYLVVSLQGEAEGKVKASLQYKNYVGYDILIIAFEDK